MKKTTLFAATVVIILTMFSVFAENINVDVYSINDFHGYLTATPKVPGITKVISFLKNEKGQNPGGTIFVAAGDMFQGTVESNLLHGRNVIDILNYAGCDAMCIGNHEFDWGQNELKINTEHSKFPWLAANVVYSKNGKVS